RHEVSAGPARAERGVVDIVLGARDAQRAHATGVVEALGVQIHPGEASERLDRIVAEAHAVTDLAEHLALDGAVARARPPREAGEGDGGAGADGVPGKGRARAEVQRPKARAAIARKVCTIDIGRARSRAHCCGRIGVTAGQAGAPLAEATIEPGENATEITS